MKRIFLIDSGKAYSYADLLYGIKNLERYSTTFRYSSLFDFYVNFLAGLISDLPVVLIDSDISGTEMSKLGIDTIESEINLNNEITVSMETLIEKINNSKSKISIFTSGTTGQPKKVEHSIKSLTRAVRTSPSHEFDIWGFAYNPTHMAGLQVFFQAFYNGNPIVNLFGKSRADILCSIDKYQITHLSATPTFYRLLKPVDSAYPSMKRITFGGERSNDELYESISNLFPNAKITNVYASTEAGTLLASKGECFHFPTDQKDKFKIVDNELLIHKSMLGFSESFSFDGNFYKTGDIIEWVDKAEGLFKFKNRKNELINVGGYKVNPAEVEDSIRTLPHISDVKVYGKSNSVLGNILCADIVTDGSGHGIDMTYIFESLKDKLQDFKIPRKIRFTDKLDLTRTGKIKR